MGLANTERIIKSAEYICLSEGVKFTPKRKEIFRVMLDEKKALSAYEIAAILKQNTNANVPVMSVYRTLDLLEQRGLVHKITSINRYSVCSHISCEHKHVMPRLAVCLECQSVDEVASNSSIKRSIYKGLKEIDFELQSQQLELVGLCVKCRHKNNLKKG